MKINIEQEVKVLKIVYRDIQEKLAILESRLGDLQEKCGYLLKKLTGGKKNV